MYTSVRPPVRIGCYVSLAGPAGTLPEDPAEEGQEPPEEVAHGSTADECHERPPRREGQRDDDPRPGILPARASRLRPLRRDTAKPILATRPPAGQREQAVQDRAFLLSSWAFSVWDSPTSGSSAIAHSLQQRLNLRRRQVATGSALIPVAVLLAGVRAKAARPRSPRRTPGR